MFWCRPACAGLKEPATVHQRNDREHLALVQFENGEEVGEIVMKDIAGDRDRVVSATNSIDRKKFVASTGDMISTWRPSVSWSLR